MPKSTAQEWNDGVPLWEAVKYYSPSDSWNEYQILSNDLFPPPPGEFVPTPIDYVAPPLPEDPAETFRRKFERLSELEHQLKAWMLDELKGRAFIALAFRLPRLRESEPVWLQAEDWQIGTADWNNSILASPGATFVDVHILRAHTQKTTKSAAAAKRNARPGRPSSKDLIIKAWEALVAAHEIPHSGPVRSLFPKIRKKVHEMDTNIRPDATGLGDTGDHCSTYKSEYFFAVPLDFSTGYFAAFSMILCSATTIGSILEFLANQQEINKDVSDFFREGLLGLWIGKSCIQLFVCLPLRQLK